MTVWFDASIKPPLDTDLIVRTAGGMVFKAQYGFAAADESGETICWSADPDIAPDCWCDGVCWGSNSAGVASDPVVAWRHPRKAPLMNYQPTGAEHGRQPSVCEPEQKDQS